MAEKALRDYNSQMSSARRRGEAIGKEIGEKIGKRELESIRGGYSTMYPPLKNFAKSIYFVPKMRSPASPSPGQM